MVILLLYYSDTCHVYVVLCLCSVSHMYDCYHAVLHYSICIIPLEYNNMLLVLLSFVSPFMIIGGADVDRAEGGRRRRGAGRAPGRGGRAQDGLYIMS